jgi:hypothetical protein
MGWCLIGADSLILMGGVIVLTPGPMIGDCVRSTQHWTPAQGLVLLFVAHPWTALGAPRPTTRDKAQQSRKSREMSRIAMQLEQHQLFRVFWRVVIGSETNKCVRNGQHSPQTKTLLQTLQAACRRWGDGCTGKFRLRPPRWLLKCGLHNLHPRVGFLF